MCTPVSLIFQCALSDGARRRDVAGVHALATLRRGIAVARIADHAGRIDGPIYAHATVLMRKRKRGRERRSLSLSLSRGTRLGELCEPRGNKHAMFVARGPFIK